MESRSDSLLDLCLEIEGLIALAEYKKTQVSESVYNLLRSKTAALHAAVCGMGSCSDAGHAGEPEADTDSDAVAESAELEASEDACMGCGVVEPEEHGKENFAEESRVVRNDTMPVEFTINDKFRFRRELFGNSDADMNEALQIISGMSSREEMEDYLFNDLCWEAENPVAKEFMDIASSRFNV